MTRLGYGTLDRVPARVTRPNRTAPPTTGIVHFGPGAFHRAHQAAYIDTLLDSEPDWGIAAVSLRSAATVAALTEQQGLYTLAVRDIAPAYRIIGAHSRFLGPDDAEQTLALLADPAMRAGTVAALEAHSGAHDEPLALAAIVGLSELMALDASEVNAALFQRLGWLRARLVADAADGPAMWGAAWTDGRFEAIYGSSSRNAAAAAAAAAVWCCMGERGQRC